MMKELIFSNSGTELLKIRPEDIIYIEADGNYCRLYLKGGFQQQLWFNRQRFISIISSQLRDDKPTFIVVGRSYIINMAYIFRINPVQSELVLFDSAAPAQTCLHASQEALNRLKKEIMAINQAKDYE